MLEKFNRFIGVRIFCIIALIFALCTVSSIATAAQTKKHHKTVAHKKATKHSAKSTTPAMPMNASTQQGIDRIISSFPDVNIGVIVQSANTGTVLYQRAATRAFMPASTLKLFTAAAALTYLGPNYIMPTQLLTNSWGPQNGVLPGNLYAKFTGDPQLTIQDLNTLINELDNEGIRTIKGNLIIDDTAIDHVNWAPGSMWDDQILCYAAPPSAMILNRNCFGFNISPARQGDSAQVNINPTFANISIINQAVTRPTNHWQCPLNLIGSGNNTYILSGCIAPGRSPMSLAAALNNPRQAGTDILIGLLKQHGISILGDVSYTKAPPNLRILAEHDSQPLGILIKQMLKKSDDLISDTIFKKLGGVYFNSTGTWTNGAQAVRAILASRSGIDFSKMVMVDGAGLSRYNLVSPAQLTTLLNYAYRSMPTNDVFYQALPISGTDGTLKYRLGGLTLGRVRAKTGTMKSTCGLAGYIQTTHNQTLTFAILINGFVGSQATYRMLEDRICQFLALNNPLDTPVTNGIPTVH